MPNIALTDIATALSPGVQATFKEVVIEAIDAVPQMNALTAQLARTTKFEAAPDGLTFVPKLEFGGKVANVPSGRMLPTPSAPTRVKGKTGLVHTYTTLAMGGQEIALTKNRRNAVVSMLEDEYSDGIARVKRDVERQYNLDGRGILCVLQTVVGAPTYGVYQPGGLTSPSGAWGTQYLVQGMEVAIINSGTGAERGRSTINDVNVDLQQVTLAALVAGAAIGDYVVLCNSVTATGTEQANNYLGEALGPLAVCNSGNTFENINGVTYRRWNSPRTNGGAAKATEFLLTTERAKIRTRSGLDPDLDYTTDGIWLDLCAEAAALKRYPDTTTFKAGYIGYTLNGRKVIPGPYCPKGCYFMLNTDEESVAMMDLVKMGYIDLDGTKLVRVQGFHVYRADLWFPSGIIWFRRACHGAVTNLSDNLTIQTNP